MITWPKNKEAVWERSSMSQRIEENNEWKHEWKTIKFGFGNCKKHPTAMKNKVARQKWVKRSPL